MNGNIKSDKHKIEQIISILEQIYPNPTTDLINHSVFELLIATMLSAQCTDKRVNLVTPALFSNYNTPEAFANAKHEDIEQLIFTTGFYKNKTKNIIECSKILQEKYGGEVPNNIDDLVKLPGVGRKTANCVLGNYFEPEGIVVDTHVIRTVNLLGFIDSKNAVKIEKYLIEIVPQKEWVNITHYFIRLGRNICVARRPKCLECFINEHCNYFKNII